MGKIKYIFISFILVFATGFIIFLDKLPKSSLVDNNIGKDQVLFMHVQTAYSEDFHTMLIYIATLDNEGNVKSFSTKISDDSDLFDNITDPNVLLLMAKKYKNDKKISLKPVPLDSVRKVYMSGKNIKDKTDYEYSVLTGNDLNTSSTIYGFLYNDDKTYDILKYYTAEKVACRLKNDEFKDYLDYLFTFFK